MTTVVYDGKILAADMRSVHRHSSIDGECIECGTRATNTKVDNAIKLLTHSRFKKITFDDKVILATAGAGEVSTIETLRYTLIKGIDPATANSLLRKARFKIENSALIVLTDQGLYVATWINTGIDFKKVDKPMAWGSGKNVALMALELGYNAVDSVKWAARYDKYTGGAVEFYDSENHEKGKQKQPITADELFADLKDRKVGKKPTIKAKRKITND